MRRSKILKDQKSRPPTLNLAHEWRDIPPEEKVRIIEEMGFTPMKELHQPDCPMQIGGRGFRCNCVPDPTYWSPPQDVCVLRHETWDERLALRQRQVEKLEREGRY